MSDPITLTVHQRPDEPDDVHRDRQIGILLVHARHTAAQVGEVTIALTQVVRDLKQVSAQVRDLNETVDANAVESKADRTAIHAQLDTVAGELTKNTKDTSEALAVTKGIADIKTTGRTLTTVVKWIGGLAAAAVGIWQLIVAVRGGGGGIGPTP